MHKHLSKTAAKKFRARKPITRRPRFRIRRRRLTVVPLRRCSFCRTEHLSSGTAVFLGITACPLCLRDDSTEDFRALLDVQNEAYQRRFAGDQS